MLYVTTALGLVKLHFPVSLKGYIPDSPSLKKGIPLFPHDVHTNPYSP